MNTLPATFIITADNPRGLNYDYMVTGSAKAREVITRIIAQGGKNIVVNGKTVEV